MKRKKAFLLMSVIFVFTIVVNSKSAKALIPPPPPRLVPGEVTHLTMHEKTGSFSCGVYVPDDIAKDYEILNVKSSKTSVVKPKIISPKTHTVVLEAKKTGKAKITLKIRQNGQDETLSYNVRCERYDDIFKVVRVGGKIQKYNRSKCAYIAKVKGKKAKVTLKLGAGWTIKLIEVQILEKDGSGTPVKKKFKNGSAYPVKTGKTTKITFILMNKNSGITVNRDVWIQGPAKKK